MNRFVLAAVALLVPLAVSVAPANAQAKRTYDCSKAGNANKAVCKAAAAKPAPAPVAPPAARNYDCSKPGNANKAVCKAAATTVKPAPSGPTATTSARHYDCSKAGNANKAACKGSTPVAVPAPTPATHAATVHTTSTTATGQNTNPGGPDGATAKCRDGSYSKSAHRSGTCSRHGGVTQWY